MKNKFFVCIELIFAAIFLFILGVGTFIWSVTDDLFYGGNSASLILLAVMLVVLPTIALVLSIWLLCPIIEVSEEKITKRLFGIKLKSYKWEEISEIKHFGNIAAQTISFYKNRKENAPFSRWIKKERIVIYCSDKKVAIIRHYAPEYIIEKIDKKS